MIVAFERHLIEILDCLHVHFKGSVLRYLQGQIQSLLQIPELHRHDEVEGAESESFQPELSRLIKLRRLTGVHGFY